MRRPSVRLHHGGAAQSLAKRQRMPRKALAEQPGESWVREALTEAAI